MAALAGMLVERGFSVTGSDNQLYEPTASLLRNSRVGLMTGFSPANLSPAPDLAVVGNVIVPTNPEAVALLASPIPYLSMPEALWHFFLKDRRVLMVAGTHGKTTSTAMMAHVLEAAGRDPSMLVGGVASDFGSNYRLGGGADFVIEGDEYDTAFFDKGPKFLHYRASGAIITAVEFDHADIYRDLEHVKSSFRALVDQMDSSRVLAVCADFPHALEVSEGSRARRLTYGLREGEYRATEHYSGCGRREIFGDARRRSNPRVDPSADRRPHECRQRSRGLRAAQRVRDFRRRDCVGTAHLQGCRAAAADNRRGGGRDGS